MQLSLAFIRLFFLGLSILFVTAFMIASPTGTITFNVSLGIGLGFIMSLFLVGLESFFRKFELRSFLTTLIGLFFGYLMGKALLLTFQTFVDITSVSMHFSAQVMEGIRVVLLLSGLYLGTIMTLRSSETLALQLPFIKLSSAPKKKKNLIIDASAISDPRILDLCTTGVFDHQLILPKFLVKDLQLQVDSIDEMVKSKARKTLEIVKKLEKMADLEMEYTDSDFPEMKDVALKFFRLAKMLECNILSADTTRIQVPSTDGIRVINIHNLSNLLKPMMQTGEIIKIKIQRYGKEPKQGVGYLDDGTMVVVNGGGDSIGEIIDAQVLSIKHTHSGRMIFCNACEEEIFSQEYESELVEE